MRAPLPLRTSSNAWRVRASLLAAGVLFAFLCQPRGYASIAVSPMRVEPTPAPGGPEQTFYLNVSNTCHETTRTVGFTVADFWIAEDGALQVGDEADPAVTAVYGGSRFVDSPVQSIQLGVREMQRVPFTVRLP